VTKRRTWPQRKRDRWVEARYAAMRKAVRRPYKGAELRLLALDLDPDAITKRLRLEPDESWRRGEPRPYGQTRGGGWLLRSTVPVGSEAQDHIESILKKIRPVKRQFRGVQRILTQCYVGLVLALSDEFQTAGFLIPANQVSELGEFGIDVGFTAYRDGKPVRWKTTKGGKPKDSRKRKTPAPRV
jgi:hypothetical protein